MRPTNMVLHLTLLPCLEAMNNVRGALCHQPVFAGPAGIVSTHVDPFAQTREYVTS